MEDSVEFGGAVYVELWVSLASLLRSYTAAHGLNGNRQATVELGETRIVVRHGGRWLDLERRGAEVIWQRENGTSGTLEMTEDGRLAPPRSQNRDRGHPDFSSPMSENTDMGHPGSGGDESPPPRSQNRNRGHRDFSSPMSENTDMGHPGSGEDESGSPRHPGSGGDEREMDEMAEEWARELMQ